MLGERVGPRRLPERACRSPPARRPARAAACREDRVDVDDGPDAARAGHDQLAERLHCPARPASSVRSAVTVTSSRITAFITSAGCSIAYTIASGASSSGNSCVTNPASASRRRATSETASAKSLSVAAAHAEQVDLLEGEVGRSAAERRRRRARRSPPAPPGRRAQPPSGPSRRRRSPRTPPRARRRRPTRARRRPDRRPRATNEHVGPGRRVPARARLRTRIDEQHGCATVDGRNGDRMADRSGTEDDQPSRPPARGRGRRRGRRSTSAR